MTWTAPVACSVKVNAKIVHAHPACGNGVAWWLEHRRGNRAAVFGEGAVDLGGKAEPAAKTLKVEKGDVDHPRGRREGRGPRLRHDRDRVQPHRDREAGAGVEPRGRHRDHRSGRQPARRHARQQGRVELRPRPVATARQEHQQRDPAAVAPRQVARRRVRPEAAGRSREARGAGAGAAVGQAPGGGEVAGPRAVRQPRRRREHAVRGRRCGESSRSRKRLRRSGCRRTQFTDANLVAAIEHGHRDQAAGGAVRGPRVRRRCEARRRSWRPARAPECHDRAPTREAAGTARCSAPRPDAAYKQLVAGHAEFRKVFPLFTCFPQVVPDRRGRVAQDVPPRGRTARAPVPRRTSRRGALDRLWVEQRFVSRQPVAENDYLPQFIGFTTQDTPKEFQQFFIDRKPLFKKRADDFLKDEEAAIPKQLDALLEFAARAYRRPLHGEGEGRPARAVQRDPRQGRGPRRGVPRRAVARAGVAGVPVPHRAGADRARNPAPVNDWELATRLSYFLWSIGARRRAAHARRRGPTPRPEGARGASATDAEGRTDPRAGDRVRHAVDARPRVRRAQTRRTRSCSRRSTPTLRKAIYEESILFFQDLFQNDRASHDRARRGLHVPERDAGEALRHPRRDRRRSGGRSTA